MPNKKPEPGDSFFFHGMEIKVSDLMPPGADFAIEPPKGPPVFYAFDKADPKGDFTGISRVYPRYEYDPIVLSVNEDDLKLSAHLDIEMRAMREAAYLEQVRKALFGGTTTAAEPWQPQTFRYEDMRRIMEEMYAAEHNRKVEQIKTLLAAGYVVNVSEAANNITVILPDDYRDALKEAKQPQRPLWPQEWPKELMDELRRPANAEAWRNQYMGSFDEPEEEG
jgi:hypothetical protein